jgi:hypothetical protein
LKSPELPAFSIHGDHPVMLWIRGIRYIVPWVVGIFVLAQLSGLIPAHYEHAGAASGHATVHVPDLGMGGARHHALADLGDECCAVHAMPVLPAVSDTAAPGLTPTHRLLSPQRMLASVRITPLDPPPKLPPPV